jgi:N-acyl-D-amino-acid deacylase
MKRLVAEAMSQGAIGLGASYSPNHSGWGGVPMPSTISDIVGVRRAGRGDGRAGARGRRDRLGHRPGRHDRGDRRPARPSHLHDYRPFLLQRAVPERGMGMFESCAAAQNRGQEVYLQFTCQPLSFDFTLAAAYPFYSHPAFDPIKAYDREQLEERCLPTRASATRSATICATRGRAPSSRVIGTGSSSPRRSSRRNAGLANRSIAEIVQGGNRDPLDAFLDLGLDEDLDTGFIGRFMNAVDEGVEPLVKHKAGVIALIRCRRASRLSVRRRVRALFPRPLGAGARQPSTSLRACAG